MNELALFAGAGGGILGGKLLGWTTLCAVERDAFAASILAQRQNDGVLEPFPIWSDVTTFDGRSWQGRVDVVSGGFPCTDISQAGKGAGIEGANSGLWREMRRVVCEVRPRYVYVENSPMLTSRGLGRILGDLAALGFNARWGVLGSTHLGADHDRERIWIVADSMPWLKPLGGDIPGSRGKQEQTAEYSHREIICQPGFLGKPDGLANRMDRNRAIGNGQDAEVARLAWQILGGGN